MSARPQPTEPVSFPSSRLATESTTPRVAVKASTVMDIAGYVLAAAMLASTWVMGWAWPSSGMPWWFVPALITEGVAACTVVGLWSSSYDASTKGK